MGVFYRVYNILLNLEDRVWSTRSAAGCFQSLEYTNLPFSETRRRNSTAL